MIYKARGIVFALMFFAASVQAGWFGPNVDAVKNELADPYSAKFENVKKEKNGAVCGEVNYKNQYGAYIGRQPFAIWNGKAFVGVEGASEVLLYCVKTPQCINVECVNAASKADLPITTILKCETKECIENAVEEKKKEGVELMAEDKSKELLTKVQRQCLSHLPDSPDLMLSCNNILRECKELKIASERLHCLEQMALSESH